MGLQLTLFAIASHRERGCCLGPHSCCDLTTRLTLSWRCIPAVFNLEELADVFVRSLNGVKGRVEEFLELALIDTILPIR